eukprot:2429424-Pleurochrysis_carterae.AAC.6
MNARLQAGRNAAVRETEGELACVESLLRTNQRAHLPHSVWPPRPYTHNFPLLGRKPTPTSRSSELEREKK